MWKIFLRFILSLKRLFEFLEKNEFSTYYFTNFMEILMFEICFNFEL
jgi:hypothetical protein